MRTFLAALLLAASLLCPCAHAQQSDAARQFQEIEAAAERGDAKAQFKLGQEYEFRTDGVSRNNTDALKWYHKAANQGFAEAQTYLGLSYFLGGIVKEDYAKAYAWYRKAAEQGYADAQYSLGLYPQLSTYAEAAKWYRKAAEQGHDDAQYLLGLCYHNGMGVERNPVETAKWYHMAAEQGHANAQFLLGGCYYEGEGVAKDYVEAVKWYRMAAENERDKWSGS